MFPASSIQSFGHGCTMPGSPGDSRGRDLDPFIHEWQGSSALLPGLQLGNADMRKDTCTPTFQVSTATGGTMGWSSKGFTKPLVHQEKVWKVETKHSDCHCSGV